MKQFKLIVKSLCSVLLLLAFSTGPAYAQLEFKFTASDKEAGDFFGTSVSISGDRAIVGANLEDTGGSNAGAAYIFERDGSGIWNEVAKVQASDKEAFDRFGISVSISGDRAIVGAEFEATGGISAGAAYIFERDGSGTWNEVAKVQASDKEADDRFGISVSISGDRAIVGAFGEDTGGGTGPGRPTSLSAMAAAPGTRWPKCRPAIKRHLTSSASRYQSAGTGPSSAWGASSLLIPDPRGGLHL